jgi:hypothetical protein
VKDKSGTKLTAGDILLNTVSVVLAFFSASFAGYMVMYGPPDRSGSAPTVSVALQPFENSHSKLGKYDIVDPIVTGSITRSGGTGKDPRRAAIELLQADPYLKYRLRTVIQDTAFIDISNGRSSVTLPVEVGEVIPGAGNVLRFERRRGRWIIVTGSSEISEKGMVAAQ